MTDFFGIPLSGDASAWNAFSDNRLYRNSEHLTPEDLAAAWGNQASVFYAFHNGDPVLLEEGPNIRAALSQREIGGLNLTPDTGIYLGDEGGIPALAVKTLPDSELPAQFSTLDMRSMVISGQVPPNQVAAIGHGWSLLSWHANNGFCANCGQKSEQTQAGYRRSCTACGREHFPRLDPVSIMLVIDGNRCLMGRQPHFMPGMYSCLAGFIEPGETLEGAVRREVQEEAGIDVSSVRYHSTQPWPFPHTLMIGCFAKAESTDIKMDETELEDCRWFDRSELTDMLTRTQDLKTPPPMAIAHQLIKTFYELSG